MVYIFYILFLSVGRLIQVVKILNLFQKGIPRIELLCQHPWLKMYGGISRFLFGIPQVVVLNIWNHCILIHAEHAWMLSSIWGPFPLSSQYFSFRNYEFSGPRSSCRKTNARRSNIAKTVQHPCLFVEGHVSPENKILVGKWKLTTLDHSSIITFSKVPVWSL